MKLLKKTPTTSLSLMVIIAWCLMSTFLSSCFSDEPKEENSMVKAANVVEAKKEFLIMVNKHKALQDEVARFIECRDEFIRLLNMTTNEDVKRMISNKLAELENNIEKMNQSLKISKSNIFEYQLVNYQMDSLEVVLLEPDSVFVDSLKNLADDDVDTITVPLQN